MLGAALLVVLDELVDPESAAAAVPSTDPPHPATSAVAATTDATPIDRRRYAHIRLFTTVFLEITARRDPFAAISPDSDRPVYCGPEIRSGRIGAIRITEAGRTIL
ncbi:hypothetical protein GCM10027068_41590 [Prescottella soli]